MSSLASAVLFIALVVTSVLAFAMYRRLKRLDAYHADYKRIFDQTATALSAAHKAVHAITTDGRVVLEELGTRIDEAKKILAQMPPIDRHPSSHHLPK